MRLKNTLNTRTLCAGLAVAGFAALSAPAIAQEVDEITVIGSFAPDGRPNSLSRVVNISDIDLRTDAGVSEVRSRVKATARDLCRELGELDRGGGVVRPCEDKAVADAMSQARPIIQAARSGALYAAAEPAPYIAPPGAAISVEESATPASAEAPAVTYTTTTVTNGPVPDTPENRARFGGPMSNGGQRTAPAGN